MWVNIGIALFILLGTTMAQGSDANLDTVSEESDVVTSEDDGLQEFTDTAPGALEEQAGLGDAGSIDVESLNSSIEAGEEQFGGCNTEETPLRSIPWFLAIGFCAVRLLHRSPVEETHARR